MAIVESLEMMKRLCCGSMERELHISRKRYRSCWRYLSADGEISKVDRYNLLIEFG